MNTLPKVSIITVCFNSAASIERTILSVIRQDYANIEYIIIDGGSTDGTVDIIKKYESKIARWISEPDKGIYDAMNKGIDYATGDYVNFMNAGDILYGNDVISSVFGANSLDDVIYGDALMVTEHCTYRQRPLPLSDFRKTLPFCHQASFARMSHMKTVKFDLSFKSAADYNFMYLLWRNEATFAYIPCVIAEFDARDGFSAKNKKLVLHEISVVNGQNKSVLGRFLVSMQYADFCLRRMIKKCLPDKLVQKISVYKRKNNSI